MKDRNLKALSFFNFACMVLTLLGAGIIVVKAETIAQYLANGVYVRAGAITPTSGAVAVADGTSFVQSTTPTFNGVNVTVDGTTTIKNYIDSVAVGVESKDARLATIAVLSGSPAYLNGVAGVGATLISTVFGALSVDGTAVVIGDRVLVKNQADLTTNGIYTVTLTGGGAAFYTLTRALDNNDASEMKSFLTSITAGGTLNGTQWLCTATQPATIGSTNITFSQFTANIGSGAVTGTLPVANGGTGASTLTGALQGNGTGAVTAGTLPVNVGGTGAATITSGNVVVGQGTAAVISTGLFLNSVPLTNAKFVNLTLQNTAGTGNQDLNDASTGAVYTVPASKIFIGFTGSYYNGNVSTATFQFELKRAATYYKMIIAQTANTLTTTHQLRPIGPFVFIASDTISFTSNVNAASVWFSGIECDAAVNVKTAVILNLANGDNTLYTVPANKSAIILSNQNFSGPNLGGNGGVYVYNASGGARLYKLNIVTSGGSATTSNLIYPSTSTSDSFSATFQCNASLGTGDFISVNTNSGTAGQMVWATVIEY